MDEPLSTEPYKGVRDFYPNDWNRLQSIFSRIRSTLVAWGYEEYNASPLERAEIYEAKTSEEIVSEQTYTFTDRGDRRVTLRPEMTPTLARMVAAKRRELPLPLRWFSIGNRFRYERPQKGRLREFYQADIDLVGLPEGEADVEIICIASAILKSFGAKDEDFVIKINSRKLFDVLAAINTFENPQQHPEVYRKLLRLLDKKDKMPGKDFANGLEELGFPPDLFSPKFFSDQVRVQAGIDKLLKDLSSAGITNVAWDPSVARGFDYYTGMIFEVFDTNPSNPRSLFGGGRYDGLVAVYGGDAIPAVGFALGDVTLSDFLEAHKLVVPLIDDKPHLYLGTPTLQDVPAAQAFADTLRKSGLRVFVNLMGGESGDQKKEAEKRGIPYFVKYDSEEIKKGNVELRTLSTRTDLTLPVSELPTRILSGK
jgi:histidyl-tRNA synthetase